MSLGLINRYLSTDAMKIIKTKEKEMSEPKTLKIDDVEYVRKDSLHKEAVKLDGMDYVCIRTYSAGVHCGYLKSRDGKEVELVNSRRLWYWSGASSLSQLAMEGVKSPDSCKFPCEVDKITLTECVEVISMTEEARKSIQGVEVWKQ